MARSKAMGFNRPSQRYLEKGETPNWHLLNAPTNRRKTESEGKKTRADVSEFKDI